MNDLESDAVLNLSERYGKIDLLSIASFGFFLVLIGVIFAITPNLLDRIYDFFHDFRIQDAYPGISLPAPASNHPVLYGALFQLCLIFAIFQVVIMVGWIILKESIKRKSGTFSGLFFWFGVAIALNLLKAGSIDWFIFIGWLVVLVGTVIVVKSAISLAFWKTLEKIK